MLRYVILAVMCSVGIKDCDVQTNSSAQTLKLRNITEYLLQNPSVKLLEQTERNLGAEMRYIMGARISGKWECIIKRVSEFNRLLACFARRSSGFFCRWRSNISRCKRSNGDIRLPTKWHCRWCHCNICRNPCPTGIFFHWKIVNQSLLIT